MLVFFKYISLFCIIFHTNAQGQNEVEKYNLNGKIKSVGIFSYDFQSINNNSFFKSALLDINLFGKNRLVEFNKKGYQIKVTRFNNRNNIQQGIYRYNKKNVKTAEIYGDFIKIFKSKPKKSIQEEIWCHSKVCKTKYINKYFGKRLMIRKNKTRGVVFGKTVYSYAEKHNKPTKKVTFLNGHKNNSEKHYTYNKDHQVTSAIKYNSKKTIEENISYKYDQKGRLSEKITFFRIFSPNYHASKYYYNAKNEIIKEINYILNTKKKVLKGSTFIRRYHYKYDTKENWIICNIYQDKVPKYTIERKIDYYN